MWPTVNVACDLADLAIAKRGLKSNYEPAKRGLKSNYELVRSIALRPILRED